MNDATDLLWRGYDLLMRGEASQAEALYRQALQQEPDNVDAITGVMQCLYVQGRYHELVGWKERLLSSPARDSAFAHVLLGAAFMHLHQCRQALEHFQQAVTLAPADVSAVQGYVHCLSRIGSWEQLRTLLPHYVTQFPDDPVLLYEYGMLLANMEDYPRALEMLQKAVSLDPSFQHYHALSWVLGKLKRWTEAKEALLHALDIGVPDEALARVYYDLGIYEVYAGNLLSAETHLWKALESSPPRSVYFQTYHALLNLYLRQRRLGKLLATWWRLLKEVLRRERPYRTE